MANLQIKGMEDQLYEEIKKLAAEENRSVSQQVLFLLRQYVALRHQIRGAQSPAQVLLELSGSWVDERSAEDLILEIRSARKHSSRLGERL
jgi:hypothetical protein